MSNFLTLNNVLRVSWPWIWTFGQFFLSHRFLFGKKIRIIQSSRQFLCTVVQQWGTNPHIPSLTHKTFPFKGRPSCRLEFSDIRKCGSPWCLTWSPTQTFMNCLSCWNKSADDQYLHVEEVDKWTAKQQKRFAWRQWRKGEHIIRICWTLGEMACKVTENIHRKLTEKETVRGPAAQPMPQGFQGRRKQTF